MVEYLNFATSINYLCTYDLYGPVRNFFDAGRYITWGSGVGGGVWPWKSGVRAPFKMPPPPL
jgi:hypothetical protein